MMTAVHFTAMSCEPITAYKAQRKPNFTKFVPVLRTLSSLGLKIYNVSVRF